MSTSPQQPGRGPRQPGDSIRREPADPAAALIFDDPLSLPSSDDTDRGWGDRPSGGTGASGDAGAAADLARFLDEKPPHHI
ncbi:hypothetical protein [Streptomyces daliensis]